MTVHQCLRIFGPIDLDAILERVGRDRNSVVHELWGLINSGQAERYPQRDGRSLFDFVPTDEEIERVEMFAAALQLQDPSLWKGMKV